MIKELLHVMLELHNVRMKPSNVRKKKKETTIYDKSTVKCAQCENGTVKCEKKVREPHNMTKKLSYVTLEPHNERMEPSNVRKKK